MPYPESVFKFSDLTDLSSRPLAQHEGVQDRGAGLRRSGQVCPHCPVRPGDLRGEVRPHHRGQLQEAGGGGRAAVHAGDPRHRGHGNISDCRQEHTAATYSVYKYSRDIFESYENVLN